MRENALFEAGDENVRKFQSLGIMDGQQRNGGVFIQSIGVGDESSMIEEVRGRFSTVGGFRGSVH